MHCAGPNVGAHQKNYTFLVYTKVAGWHQLELTFEKFTVRFACIYRTVHFKKKGILKSHCVSQFTVWNDYRDDFWEIWQSPEWLTSKVEFNRRIPVTIKISQKSDLWSFYIVKLEASWVLENFEHYNSDRHRRYNAQERCNSQIPKTNIYIKI